MEMSKVLILLCIFTVVLSKEVISYLSPDCGIVIHFSNDTQALQTKLLCKLMCNNTKELEMVIKQPETFLYRIDEIDKTYNRVVAVQLKKDKSVECSLVDIQSSSDFVDALIAESFISPTLNECGENYLLFKNIDWCVKISTRILDWYRVSQACISEGGVLAVVDTPEKDKAISEYLKENDIKDVWIALSDTKEEGNFVWIDGTPLTNESFQNWHRKQPDDWEGNEDCVHYSQDWEYEWNDVRCDATFQYLCERKKTYGTVTVPVPNVPNKGTLTCHAGWDLIEEAETCYRIGAEELTFSEAEDYCLKLDGFLASIPKAPEMKLIQELLNRSVSVEELWIGLQRVNDITFQWIDGTNLTHESWISRQPDNKAHKCVFLNRRHDYMWDDSNCDNFYRPLCRKNATRISFYAQVCPSGCLFIQNSSDFKNPENTCPSHSSGSLVCPPNTENYRSYLIIVSGISSVLFIVFFMVVCFYFKSRRKMWSQKPGPLGNGNINRAMELRDIGRLNFGLTPYAPPPFLPPPKMDDIYDRYESPPSSLPSTPKGI